MVRFDFTVYKNFSACPIWWRNFVLCASKDAPSQKQAYINFELDKSIKKYNGSIIDNEDPEDLDALEFETEEDFNAFKIYWTLYGS
jgi:hypothetical protein